MTDVLQIPVDDIRPGMILKAASAKGTATRKVYKIVHGCGPGQRWNSSIWSILVRYNKTTGEWIEECQMVENLIDRLTKMIVMVDGRPVERRIRILPRE